MPQELSERQKTILDAVIREYVATAEPVASEHVVRAYRLPHSPATVRNELLALDEAGYLAQPHTSAGRVPTDRGYRFFINRMAGTPQEPAAGREERAFQEIRELGDPIEFAKHTSRILAHLTRNFVIAGFPDEDLYYKSGLSEIMQEPEFTDRSLVHEFGMLLDVIEDELTRALDFSELGEPLAFIGSENPIRRARRYSMIISTTETPFGKESVIALVGPKRMDYAHNLALLRHLRQMLAA